MIIIHSSWELCSPREKWFAFWLTENDQYLFTCGRTAYDFQKLFVKGKEKHFLCCEKRKNKYLLLLGLLSVLREWFIYIFFFILFVRRWNKIAGKSICRFLGELEVWRPVYDVILTYGAGAGPKTDVTYISSWPRHPKTTRESF